MTTAKWPCDLGPAINPIENTIRAQAQSILSECGCPLLPFAQALDVVRWHNQRTLPPGPFRRFSITRIFR